MIRTGRSMDVARGGHCVPVRVDDLHLFMKIVESELACMEGLIQRMSNSNWMVWTGFGLRWGIDVAFLQNVGHAVGRLYEAKCQLSRNIPLNSYEPVIQRPCLPLRDQVMEPRGFQGEDPKLRSDMEELKRELEAQEAKMEKLKREHEVRTAQLRSEHEAEMKKLKEEHIAEHNQHSEWCEYELMRILTKELQEQKLRYDKELQEQELRYDKELQEQELRYDKEFKEQRLRYDKEFNEQKLRYDKEFKEEKLRDEMEFKEVVSKLLQDNDVLLEQNKRRQEQIGKLGPLQDNDVLLKQNKRLQEQIRKLEVQRGRQCGFYLDCAATPNDMQLLSQKMKQSLASFTKTLMYSAEGASKDVDWAVAEVCVKPYILPGFKLERNSDVKFCYQKDVSETVFGGFEAEDFQIPECDSEQMDVGKRRSDSYTQYNELKNWVPTDYDPRTITERPENFFAVSECVGAKHQATCPSPSDPVISGCCSPGQQSFLAFRHRKTQQIMRESKTGSKFWGARGKEEVIALRRRLHTLLRDVWLCHLLAFSFDPPCTLFKVKVGSVFDSAYMESIRNEEDEEEMCNSDAVRRVAFMIMPGFHIGKAVVRAQVYDTFTET